MKTYKVEINRSAIGSDMHVYGTCIVIADNNKEAIDICMGYFPISKASDFKPPQEVISKGAVLMPTTSAWDGYH